MYFITTKGTGNLELLGTNANRNDARAFAKANEGTVRSQAEYANLIADGRLPRTPVAADASQVLADEVGTEDPTDAEIEESNQPAAPVSFLDMAKAVTETIKVRNTLGKKEKLAKRATTSPEALEAAATAIRDLLGENSKVTKVGAVRAMAAWAHTDGTKLQRRDALQLFAEATAGAIAPATVSTQWQLVRSGKL